MADSGKKGIGVESAAQMLSGLDKENRDRVLEIMSKKDPKMAELIKMNLVQIDDLKNMTVSMLQDFMKEVDLKDLALALKFADKTTVKFFCQNLSKSMALEITDIIDIQKVQKSTAQQAYQKVMDKVRLLVDKGTLILNKDSDQFV